MFVRNVEQNLQCLFVGAKYRTKFSLTISFAVITQGSQNAKCKMQTEKKNSSVMAVHFERHR